MMWTIATALLIIQAITCQAHHDYCRQNTLVTFNAGLIPTIPLYETRKLQLAQAIKETNADVVCLQEVVYEDDLTRILDHLQWEYPYSWSFLHSGTYTSTEAFKSKYLGDWYKYLGEKPFPCLDPALPAFQQCLTGKCGSAAGGIVLRLCLFQNCVNEGFALSDDCLSCVVTSASSPQTILSKCAIARQDRSRYRFQAEGLLVLSKKPILSARKTRYIPDIKQILPRGLLEVDIHGTGKLVCTHLTSDGNGIPYVEVKLTEALGIKTYVDQQTRDIATLRELYKDQTVILAGDLNTGPAVPSQNINGELPENYAALITTGFDSPYVEQVGKCTYCNDNPLAINTTSVIDHVLLNGYQAFAATEVEQCKSRASKQENYSESNICRRTIHLTSNGKNQDENMNGSLLNSDDTWCSRKGEYWTILPSLCPTIMGCRSASVDVNTKGQDPMGVNKLGPVQRSNLNP